ncbi:hypothetical protein BAE44_0009435 [Dichanthelium oligosanthes]|uniref:Uncharacterized protein n=1 Tax=Dichanthelium oligosanthes TaxID=888268 RepID=A0A1E5VWT7_9POAL|nr:hypothetical protein BAE44_0009435 [Dichanthelium oligosanthes]
MPGAAAAGVDELLLTSFDPFADAELGDDEDGGAPTAPRDDVVHLRTQQRNGRKSLTTVQGSMRPTTTPRSSGTSSGSSAAATSWSRTRTSATSSSCRATTARPSPPSSSRPA